MGHDIIQLHPLDAGVLLELDALLPRDGWFWDDLPEAQAAQGARTTKADDIVAVEIAIGSEAAGPGSWPSTCTPPTEHGTGEQGELCHTMINFV